MERELKVKEDSINASGIKKDYKEAIVEYIWNGFDAGATKVEISYNKNSLDGVESISIKDNGCGILYENLENTFDAFLSSEKKVNKNHITTIHGNKGKGRFSFLGFASNCKWDTVYENDNKKYGFSIEINSQKPNKYTPSEKKEVIKSATGTIVTIYNIENLMEDQMKSKELKEYILESFAWFLYLKKSLNYQVVLNGEQINFNDFIDGNLTEDYEEEIEGEKFNIFFIKWNGEVKYKYFFHMMDSNNNQITEQHTRFNNNGVGFVHSVFVVSEYFNGFESLIFNKAEENGQISINIDNKKNEKDETYKKLLKRLDEIVNQKYKEYIKEESNSIIKSFEDDKIFPEFSNDIYGRIRKKELVNTVKEVYCVHPKVFKGASKEQKKIIVHFLDLLLSSDERENILSIMDNITNLSKEERESLANVLTRTSLSCIVETIKMLDERNIVIEKLKKLVFEMTEFTNERNHIQKIMERNYWIFGEEYNLVTADKHFEKALSEYRYILDGYKNKEEYEVDSIDKKKRMDIFMCAKRPLDVYENSSIKEENIILELKAPTVTINAEIFQQIESYMELIRKEPQFNSSLREWKFYAVSNEVDDFIKGKYEENEAKGQPFLVKALRNYKIFIMTWDDVFKNFEHKHRFIYDKLIIDKEKLESQFEEQEKSREGSNKLTEEINNRAVV